MLLPPYKKRKSIRHERHATTMRIAFLWILLVAAGVVSGQGKSFNFDLIGFDCHKLTSR